MCVLCVCIIRVTVAPATRECGSEIAVAGEKRRRKCLGFDLFIQFIYTFELNVRN